MSSNQYEHMKNEVDILIHRILTKITDAESLNDIGERNRWTDYKEKVEFWKLANNDGPLPIPESVFTELHVDFIVFDQTAEAEPDNTSGDSQTKSPLENISILLGNLDNRIKSTEETLELVDIKREISAIEIQIANLKNSEDHLASFEETRSKLDKKIIETANVIYKSARKAIADKNYDKARASFADVIALVNTDQELYKNAQDELAKLPTPLSREDIDNHLLQISSRDRRNVETSLRILETYKNSALLTADEIKIVIEARQHFDKESEALGRAKSVSNLGNLREKFKSLRELDYLNNRFDLGEMGYEARLKDYKIKSAEVCNHELANAKLVAEVDPTAAKNKLVSLLVEKTQEEIGGQTLTIFANPFDDDDKNRINERITQLIPLCEEQQRALEIKKEGDQISDAFLRFEKYIEAYRVFRLHDLDETILKLRETAVRVRIDKLKNQFSDIKRNTEELARLPENEIEKNIEIIENERSAILSNMSYWPAEGLEFKSKSGVKRIEYPEELKNYNQDLHGKLEEFYSSFSRLKETYLRLCKISKEFQQYLDDPGKRNGIIRTFHTLSVIDVISDSAIYRDLSSRITQYDSFGEILKSIEITNNEQNWSGTMGKIKDLYNRSDYVNCPADIKQKVKDIQQNAEPRYHLQYLENYIKSEEYSAALIELDWLKKNHTQESDYSNFSGTLDQLLQSGKEIYGFYKAALNELSLDENHYLVSVLFDRQSLLNRVLDKQFSEEAIANIKVICGEKLFSFSDVEYKKKLANFISSKPIMQIEGFIKKMDRVAGRTVNIPPPEWPAYTNSIVKNNARIIAEYFREYIREMIIVKLNGSTGDNREYRLFIEAALNTNVAFSEDDLFRLSEADYRLTEEEIKQHNYSEEDIYTKWENLHKRWPKNQLIQNEYKLSKINKYSRDINFCKENGDYNKAYEIVNLALNDSETGAQDKYFFEKIELCLNLGKLDEAKSIIGEIKRRIPGEEISILETKERVLRLLAKNISSPAEVIRQLIILSKEDVNKKEIDQKIKEYFKEQSDKIYQLIKQLKSATNNIDTLENILLLREMEDEYKKYAANYTGNSPNLLTGISATLFDLGMKLNNETTTDVQNNENLELTIQKFRESISRKEAFLNLFRSFIPDLDNQLTLKDAVGKIIDLDPDQSARKNNHNLLDRLSKFDQKPVKIIDIETKITKLKDLLEKHQELLDGLKTACQPDLWINAIDSEVQANDNPLESIERIFNSLTKPDLDIEKFYEVKTYKNSLDIWKENLIGMHKILDEVQKFYYDCKFQEAKSRLDDIYSQYNKIVNFDPFDQTATVKYHIKEKISIADTRRDNIIGYEAVVKQVSKLLLEQKSWRHLIEEQKSSMDKIIHDKSLLLGMYDTFYSKLEEGERQKLNLYGTEIDKLKKLQTTQNIEGPLHIENYANMNNTVPVFNKENEKTKKSILDQLFRKKAKKESKLVTSLKRPQKYEGWKNSSLDEQVKIINNCIDEINKMQERDRKKPEANCNDSDLNRQKNQEYLDEANKHLEIFNTLLDQKCEFEKNYPYPDKEVLGEKSNSRQYIAMAQLIINADLLGQRADSNYIENYRSHVIENLTRGGK